MYSANAKTIRTPAPEVTIPHAVHAKPATSQPEFAIEAATPSCLKVKDLGADALLAHVPQHVVDGRSFRQLDCVVLVGKLGQGGMGAVYLGYHRRLKKKVAVKILPLQGAIQPEMVQRFHREAQLAAQVQSPHLVGVLDVNEQEGLSYIVMELVDGPSARDVLAHVRGEGRRGLPEALALEICIAAAHGVAAAHAAGIIHRDLKPDNILLPCVPEKPDDFHAGGAKVADLGLGRQMDSSGSLTGTNGGLGTPGYMAPEQSMNAGSAGKPADVFGLGATLYALVCGHAPFHDDEAMRVILATLQEPHVPARKLIPELSYTTNALLERCLSKDPVLRFADAAVLLGALQSCQAALNQTIEQQKLIAARWDEMLPPLPKPPGETIVKATETVAQKNESSSSLFGSVGLLFRRGADSIAYMRAMSSARSAMKRKRWTQAEEFYRAALSSRPGDSKAREGIDCAINGASDTRFQTAFAEAENAVGKQDWEAARQAYQRALSERPQHTGAISGRELAVYQQSILRARHELQPVIADAKGNFPDLDIARRNRIESALAEALAAKPADRAATELLQRIGDPAVVLLDLGEGVEIPLVRVREGEFEMGSAEGAMNERPARRVKISRTYYLSKTPVTVRQYERFVKSTGYETQVQIAGKGMGLGRGNWELLKGVSYKDPGYAQTPDHPAVLLSWFDSQAFCFWLAKNSAVSWSSRQNFIQAFLPSEALWEYAARGPKNLRYPWGQIWDGSKANHADANLHAKGVDLMCSPDNDGFAFASPVGRYENASWCGALDLIGNIWEWCQDWHQDDYYEVAPPADPRGPEKGAKRAVRGGSWADMPLKCKAFTRRGAPPEGAATNIGFRFAVSFHSPD